MSKKRLLMLTLGSGVIEIDKIGYRETQYEIKGEKFKRNGEVTKTNFVAEPLIYDFQPDIIFILGTVRSVWHQLFATMITEDNNDESYRASEDFIRLFEIESSNGIKTDKDELKSLEKEISDIFSEAKWDNKIIKWKKLFGEKYQSAPEVHILLTKYGVNEEELQDNYSILKTVEDYLNKEDEYEVAFDISHSFRSLSIYNLIIFNYIKSITDYKIKLSHVYYGNFDAQREYNGIAPIVDLSDVIDVMDLSNAVMEFKDTGNAISLYNLLPESEDDNNIRSVLERFDYATQINAFDKIKNELKNLCIKVESHKRDYSRYDGISEMISSVLLDQFFGGDIKKRDALIDGTIKDADLRFLLTEWYFNQNRIGLALATGLEALRDIVTEPFVATRAGSVSDEECRKNAEEYFIRKANKLEKKSERTEFEEAVYSLGSKLKGYKALRNIFAHALIDQSNRDFEDIKTDVTSFKESLFRLKEMLLDKDENSGNIQAFQDLFKSNSLSAAGTVVRSECRLVISFNKNEDYRRFKSTSAGKKYDVYYLRNNVIASLFGDIEENKYETVKKAYFLYQYIEDNIGALDEYDSIKIILNNCPKKDKEAFFRIMLEFITDKYEKVMLLIRDENGQINKVKKYNLLVSLEDLQEKYQRAYSTKAVLTGTGLMQLI